jgi:hypothetical protein
MSIRQSPLLGQGGGDGRQLGGFWKFAHEYVRAEGGGTADVKDRCFFERYQDFAFYSGGDWWAGKKLPLVIIEAESKSKELLAELSGILAVRSPVKYLFISGVQGLFDRLTSYCASTDACVTDWAGTTYFVIEIPDEPILPSKWVTYRADVNSDRGKLCFGLFPAGGSDALSSWLRRSAKVFPVGMSEYVAAEQHGQGGCGARIHASPRLASRVVGQAPARLPR